MSLIDRLSNKPNENRGLSLADVLGIVFITLKLVGTIDWSWWWVTAPFWGPLALFCILFIAFGCSTVIGFIVEQMKKNK